MNNLVNVNGFMLGFVSFVEGILGNLNAGLVWENHFFFSLSLTTCTKHKHFVMKSIEINKIKLICMLRRNYQVWKGCTLL